jgi:exodeoxyribonuclease V beta subunit
MKKHRYDLQYHIYTVALHRYLSLTLSGYSYEKNFGGVYYIFLRGADPGTRNGIFYDRPVREKLETIMTMMAG